MYIYTSKNIIMKQILFYCLLFISFPTSLSAQSSTPLTIGVIHHIHSNILNEDRQINVYLPDSFSSSKTYPVIYLLDGSIHEDFIHIVGLAQFFNMMYNMPPTIIIGISNIDRKRDYTFHTDLKDLQKDYPTTGHSDKFIAFIQTELQPFIEKTYPTNNIKIIIGQSLGGLLATEILLKKPNLFSHYLITSPSLWWDNESLLKNIHFYVSNKEILKKYIYIGVGGKEAKIMKNDAKQLFENIQKSHKNIHIHFATLQPEDHATVLHQSIYTAFKWLYQPKY